MPAVSAKVGRVKNAGSSAAAQGVSCRDHEPISALLSAVSRAFVKEPDGDVPDDLPQRSFSPHPNRVTPRGLALLRAQLAIARERLAVLPADAAASAKQGIERDVAWLEARVATAIVVQAPLQQDRVGLGATVTMVDDAGEQHRYRIGGEGDEAVPDQGSVSWVSPLAQTLDGARIGDVVTWPRPAGDLEIEVIGIRYDDADPQP